MKKNKNLGNTKISYGISFLIVGIVVVFAGYRYFKDSPIFDQEQQKNMTPEQIVQDLVGGNTRFYSNTPLNRQSLLVKAQKASKYGQFPKAVILACMDSRSIPEIVFDQTVADIFTLRVAGNVVNQDILASLEYATKYSGSKVIVVMGHTQCGAIKAVCAGGLTGNLASLANAIEPAVAMIQRQSADERLDCDDVTIKNIAMQNVHNMIVQVIEGSAVIRELVSQGNVEIVGALHDLESGVVTFFEEIR